MDKNEPVVFPDDLTGLSLADLQSLQTRALAEFDELAGNEEIGDEGVGRLETLATGIDSLTTAIETASTKSVAAASKVADLRGRVNKFRPPMMQNDTTTADAGETGESGESDGDGDSGDAGESVVASSVKPTNKSSLAAASANAPVIPAKANDNLVITAAAATSGMPIGSRIDTSDALVAAVQNIARSLSPTAGTPSFQMVASIANHFEHTVDGLGATKLNELEEILRNIRSPERVDALIADGWCAPSEQRYDFFNITCQDGMVDVPTIGIRRGGIQFPVSPSLASVYTGTFTNATNPWLWTEGDDILSATGSPTKPCVRVACPSFDEARLECYGICLTAGNLTDYAYPEATRNHLALLMSAHYHAMNARYLTTMASLSTAIGTIPATGTGILSDAPAATALAASDYRERFGMCDRDVVEVIFPRWVKDAMRIDHLRRNGFWASPLSDSDINKLFTANRVRVQWVGDWQVRGSLQPGNATPIGSWPATVQFMIYAAGTFVRGNGLSLDLGVVRDSVLNSTNDHTAAWTEECHLIARLGHESRLYTVPVCTAGRTGINDVDCTDSESSDLESSQL